MNGIASKFEQLKTERRKGFIPFVTAGDPDVDTSVEIVVKLADLGADVIELGVPFSDPVADGATIQRSSQRALQNGVNISKVLEMTRRIRERTSTPLVLFSYLNPLLRYDFAKLCRDASDAGVDGILITDVVDDEAAALSRSLADCGLDLISLIAPTTTDERLKKIAGASRGFLYAVSRAGVTGARDQMTADARSLVERARQFADLPIAVGFGISTREQVSDVWSYADAAVVGSAIVAEIEQASVADAVRAVEARVRAILPQFAKSGAEL
jgi:tryptophan synthase alpha chain